jgi:hypothetical protein
MFRTPSAANETRGVLEDSDGRAPLSTNGVKVCAERMAAGSATDGV